MPTPMTRIEDWFATHLPELLDDLEPGCGETALASESQSFRVAAM